MLCLNHVFVCGFCQVLIRSARYFYFVGALLFCDNLQTDLGVLLLGRALLLGTLQYSHFESCLGFGLTLEVDKINSGTTIHDVVCLIQPITCLLMFWGLWEPGHQQAWNWPPKARIFLFPASAELLIFLSLQDYEFIVSRTPFVKWFSFSFFSEACQIAIDLMLQEDFGSNLTKHLAWYSCHLAWKNCPLEELEPEPVVEEDDGEVWNLHRSVMVQIMAWCQTGDKPLFEPVMAEFTDT